MPWQFMSAEISTCSVLSSSSLDCKTLQSSAWRSQPCSAVTEWTAQSVRPRERAPAALPQCMPARTDRSDTKLALTDRCYNDSMTVVHVCWKGPRGTLCRQCIHAVAWWQDSRCSVLWKSSFYAHTFMLQFNTSRHVESGLRGCAAN